MRTPINWALVTTLAGVGVNAIIVTLNVASPGPGAAVAVACASLASAALVTLYRVGAALEARTEVQRHNAERHTAVTDELLARLRQPEGTVRIDVETGRFVM
jgi:protein-S-isoprenylcysteine O-methyltransferase Ste14